MVIAGGKSKHTTKKPSVLVYISWGSQFLLFFLAFLMIVTIFDVDAPSDHDLNTIHTQHLVKQEQKKTIGYAATITQCGSDGDVVFHIAEGAAVLAHSIKMAHEKSPYDYQIYAIYHPQAEGCAHLLQALNYTLVPRDTPVKVNDIKGNFLRERIENNGCCGEKELIKLEAFTLTQHDVVVLLDLDVILLQPLDRLFNFLIKGKALPREDVQWPDRRDPPSWREVSVLYTVDYAMVGPERETKPTQGGFLVMRPDLSVYEELRKIILEGDFRDRGGWGGISGKFWGAMTIQGLLPYYFKVLHKEKHSVELNRWVYDNMCSPSRKKNKKDVDDKGVCYTQEEKCESCGDRPLTDIALVHFTVCQKPWLCMLPNQRRKAMCSDFHHEWFRIRSDMEKNWGRSGMGPGKDHQDHFFGYCDTYGKKGYQMIAKPYGHKLNH